MAVKMTDYKKLPVYEQKEKILECLKENQVIVVQSPTGSGKTTQIPVILHEAGFSESGVIAVTQPRRIAALSVSEFIARQLGTTYPGLVGYKMRFEDFTDATTKIKIMTDGILLQEMKLDPLMSKYSVIMVDEAHERSLTIDFVLGLLKRCLEVRKDLKIIVSSATMNAEAFSKYFGGCPIVTIDTVTYPVTLIYDPPEIPASTLSEAANDAMLSKIEGAVERVVENGEEGGILIFLPGEKAIHDCVARLSQSRHSHRLFILPLYGRLPKEEQENVFLDAPRGKIKVIVSTNIAETSVTIDGITTVIDSGLAKLNFYSPRTYTSSLIETPVSKASCLQRRGRAGRTGPGTCYRLYSKKDFETREEYTTEEIFRTDLSEVILRMAELGIRDFEKFDFISKPSPEGIKGGVKTLFMLKALDADRTLSSIGKMMALFPLLPRISRIIVEAILKYPEVLQEALIAAAFLSTHSPFVLPQGSEMEARKAHHRFNDERGDFVGYVKLYRAYEKLGDEKKKQRFAEKNFLDYKVLAEIQNIVAQLSEIVGEQGIPISGGGPEDDYLCCVASGMIQFVCAREGSADGGRRERGGSFRTLTADHITIHPGSSLFRANPPYIVAGEIVKTSRMFAMSVSPLTKNLLYKIDADLEERLESVKSARTKKREGEFTSEEFAKKNSRGEKSKKSQEGEFLLGGVSFKVSKVKGKKTVELPCREFLAAVKNVELSEIEKKCNGFRAKVLMEGGYKILEGEKLFTAMKVAKVFGIKTVDESKFDRKSNFNLKADGVCRALMKNLKWIMCVAQAKKKSREMGFVCLFTDGNSNYWLKVSRGFSTALSETISSLETLADDENANFSEDEKQAAGDLYAKLNSFFEN